MKIGLCGTGEWESSDRSRLLGRFGHRSVSGNRNSAKTSPWTDAVAKLFAMPLSELVTDCEVRVGRDAAECSGKQPISNRDRTAYNSKLSCASLVIDMSTIRPDTMTRTALRCWHQGAAFVESLRWAVITVPAKVGKSSFLLVFES